MTISPESGWRWSIDRPATLFASGGKLECDGWCLNEKSRLSAEVRLVVDGRMFPSKRSFARPDVGAAFPSLPQAKRSGFAIDAWIPPGYHTAYLEARLKRHEWTRLKSLALCSEIGPLVAYLDTPVDDPVSEGPVKLWGWTLHPQEHIAELTMHVGALSVRCYYGRARRDVRKQFPDIPHSETTGFACELKLPAGAFSLSIAAKLANGGYVVHHFHQHLVVRPAQPQRLLNRLDEYRAGLIAFEHQEAPQVSILVPVFNQLEATLNCLRSIAAHSSSPAYEVIVVNDASDEHTSACLESIAGLRLITHSKNSGFVTSCNDAAAAARGEFLVFLNNDTEVTPGWLTALLRVFELRADAGLVGAKLVYPDGKLQEAGGIMWQDASGVNYGKWDDPRRPKYNYLREVDYCSGACLVVPKELFMNLGGFDNLYLPAYYEDTDLAFKVRASGKKVYYQPLAEVIHHEGQTSGRSTSSGVKRYQLVNERKFYQRWRATLLAHPTAGSDVDAAANRSRSRRALVVDARALSPDQDSGSMRMWRILQILQELDFRVTFAPLNRLPAAPYTQQMQLEGIEYLCDPYLDTFERLLRQEGTGFDLIILSRAEVAAQVLPECLRYTPDTPVIFDTVDLHFLRTQREAALTTDTRDRAKAVEMERLELGLARDASAVVVVSREEQELLQQKLGRKHIAVISNIHDVHVPKRGYEGRRDFLFIGGFEHTPNSDAMLWFSREVMPLVAAELPDAKLNIVGSKMPAEVKKLASANIVVHGYVPDVAPLFEQCLLSVAPLRYGAGVKGKINQSMSFGVPVVTTSIGAEGMNVVHERDILIADDASQFAKEIVRLHHDRELWSTLSRNSIANVDRNFSYAKAKQNLTQLLASLHLLDTRRG